MDKYRTIFIICLGVLGLLALAGYALFEIYPVTDYYEPSVESLSNEYLALDRWLQKTGHPLNINTTGKLASPDLLSEKTLLIQSSRFGWSGKDASLRAWIEAGGNLVIFADLPWYDDEEGLSNFLEGFGITIKKFSSLDYEEENEEAATIPDAPEDDSEEPDLDLEVYFLVEEKPDAPARILQDRRGKIRMVTMPRGQGSITALGVPYFMWSAYIGEKQNARLAWRLTGALDRDNQGIYFIRGKTQQASRLWGKLAERGNITALVAPVLILILVGFWMVLPAFGRPVRDEERPGKPIGERFRAESRFLRKYGALDLYLEAYVEELWTKLRVRQGMSHPDQMVLVLAERWGMDVSAVEKIIHPKGKLTYRDFVNSIRLIENTEERL
ncbi:MAG: hypothetical protein LBG25_03355 [Spirochaetaceae bacterium]|jgi:hypothetical protein|nr:hypothetical protein [Spirochaetaceae bacterium]